MRYPANQQTVWTECESKRQHSTNCHFFFKIQAVHVCNLKCREFLDYFRDGVNGLGIWEQAVGDGCDDVKGTLQKLPWVRAIQLPWAKHTFDAVP